MLRLLSKDVPPQLVENINAKIMNKRKALAGCLHIDGGYYSDVYACNKNYNIFVKWYKKSTTDVQVHIPDYEVLKALGDMPNVPKLLAYSDECCVLSRMPGTTLDKVDIEILKRHRDRILEAVKTFAEKAKEAGFIINDVHTGNVLITNDGDIGIIDFNAYIETQYALDLMFNINNNTKLFDNKGVDIRDESAINVLIDNCIYLLEQQLNERLEAV